MFTEEVVSGFNTAMLWVSAIAIVIGIFMFKGSSKPDNKNDHHG